MTFVVVSEDLVSAKQGMCFIYGIHIYERLVQSTVIQPDLNRKTAKIKPPDATMTAILVELME